MKAVGTESVSSIHLVKKWVRILEPYWYIAPTIALVLLFTYYPFLKSIKDSFTFVSSDGRAGHFAGFENYKNVLNDPSFRAAIQNTLIYVLLIVPSGLVISLMLALLANRRRKLSSIYETMYALPMAMTVSTAALIIRFILNPSLGVFNYLFHVDIQWFADKKYAIFALSSLEIWLQIGFSFLFLLSAVRNVPIDLLENSQIEGAGYWQRVRYLVLPMISPTLFFLFCTNLISTMLIASPIIILTQGGPDGSTQSIMFYMYNQAFYSFNYGKAYASALVGFMLTLAFMLVSFMYEKKGVHYQ